MTAYTDARALELLLSVIFYPHNSYCIHLDPKVAQSSNVCGCGVVNYGTQLLPSTTLHPDLKVALLICLIVASRLVSCHTKCQPYSAKSLVSQSHRSEVMSKECWSQAEPDFLATVENILECYRLRFPATHIRQSSRFDLQKTTLNSPLCKHD